MPAIVAGPQRSAPADAHRAAVDLKLNGDGRREVLGMEIGTSEAEPIWTEFLRKLRRRGLRGVKLVVSNAHESLQ
ncbi:hypothetical protein MESS2_950010 [Mesorhizobium metallidurans STM 2683]|uniref:Mutator family transposase n=1 Tax=Mesorhizobium metallidurans STM 2683 TaxID=1297569 RepID=M5EZ76_9HYPH|nr:hypothetical protein MESS2_950010 [Mesorhizobium metallidurans STM 2683]